MKDAKSERLYSTDGCDSLADRPAVMLYMRGRDVMEQLDSAGQAPTLPAATKDEKELVTVASSPNSPPPEPACPACGTMPAATNSVAGKKPSFVYAIGKIEPRFPQLSVEKEFAQATGRAETAGLTDRQAVQRILSQPQNRYLARQMCWVLTIQGLETYVLTPRDSADLDLLVEALRSRPGPHDLDCVVGLRGPVAPPEMCGLAVPIAAFDQIYSFDRESLIKAIPRPSDTSARNFTPAAEELFDRIIQITDNAGATDEHRAMNYLALRYHAIYAKAAEAFARNASLSAVHAVPSRLSGARNIIDIIFSFTDRNTDVTEKQFVRVDVTEEFPFLVTKLSAYYDR